MGRPTLATDALSSYYDYVGHISEGSVSQISVARAKAEFAALVSRAEAGEQIVVTRNGKPVACLGPLPEKQPVVYGDLAHLAPLFRSLELEDLSLPDEVIEDFERSAAEFKWP